MNNKQIANFDNIQSSEYGDSLILIKATNSHINMGISITLKDLKASLFKTYKLDDNTNVRNYKSIPQKYQKLYDYITTFALLNIDEHHDFQFRKPMSGYSGLHAHYSSMGLFDLSGSLADITTSCIYKSIFGKLPKRRMHDLTIPNFADIVSVSEKLQAKTYSQMKKHKIDAQMIRILKEVEL